MSRIVRTLLAIIPSALAAQAPAPVSVTLAPVVPAPGMALRWSPKGATVALTLKARMLSGAFPLGPGNAPPIKVQLAKTGGETHYNTLWVDINRDGKLTENEKLTVTPKEIRGKWWSSFDTIVDVPVPAGEGGVASTRPYSLALWYVEDPQEPTAPPTLRWSRRGWHVGQVEIGGKPAYVLITEMEMDGKFDQRDSWAMSRNADTLLRATPRGLDEHYWIDGAAYRPVKIDESGRSLSMVQVQPGTTEAEEAAQKDIYLPDRFLARAPQPLAFGKDLPTVLAQAKLQNKRVLIDFEAVWCGPCHSMDQLVWTAQSIVNAAKGVIAVKVDGDDHHDLKVAYKVDGYPTMILLDATGKELRRGVGYQSVLEMLELLKP